MYNFVIFKSLNVTSFSKIIKTIFFFFLIFKKNTVHKIIQKIILRNVKFFKKSRAKSPEIFNYNITTL